jgi:hypothetical protein
LFTSSEKRKKVKTCLPSKCKALSSNSSTEKGRKEGRKGKEGGREREREGRN